MHTNVRWAIGVIAAVSALGMTMPAWADNDRGDHRRDRRDERREHRRDVRERWEERRQHDWHRAAQHREGERREWERRREWDRHRAAAHWRFERDRGWRFEHRPGFWSPHFVWWRVDGLPVLRPFPTHRIVRYQHGYYELLGDGFTIPYHWVWRPTVVIATPPPPVPLPPPPPADYPFPPGGLYPPPPTG
jgi:hypothetical protein